MRVPPAAIQMSLQLARALPQSQSATSIPPQTARVCVPLGAPVLPSQPQRPAPALPPHAEHVTWTVGRTARLNVLRAAPPMALQQAAVGQRGAIHRSVGVYQRVSARADLMQTNFAILPAAGRKRSALPAFAEFQESARNLTTGAVMIRQLRT